MKVRRLFLLLLACSCAASFSLRPPGASHPALDQPDGQSHRGDKMVGDTLTKREEILALGKLYQSAKAFEARQEYFLRLLDYFHVSQDRLTGMTRADIEKVFGPGAIANEPGEPSQFAWAGGRDTLFVSFEGDLATGAFYAMGF